MMKSDLSYFRDDYYICVLPNTKVGEIMWRHIVKSYGSHKFHDKEFSKLVKVLYEIGVTITPENTRTCIFELYEELKKLGYLYP